MNFQQIKEDLFSNFWDKLDIVDECNKLFEKLKSDDQYLLNYKSKQQVYKIIQMKLIHDFPKTAEAMNFLFASTKFVTTDNIHKAWKELIYNLELKVFVTTSVKKQLQDPIKMNYLIDMYVKCCNLKHFQQANLGKIVLELVQEKQLMKHFVEQFFETAEQNLHLNEHEYIRQRDFDTLFDQMLSLVRSQVPEFVEYALTKFSFISFDSIILYESYQLYQKYKDNNSRKIFELIKQHFDEVFFAQSSQKKLCTSEKEFDTNNIPNPMVTKQSIVFLYIPTFFQEVDVNKYFTQNYNSNQIFSYELCQIHFIKNNYTNTLTKQLDAKFNMDYDWYKKQIQYVTNLSKEDKYVIFSYTSKVFNDMLHGSDYVKDKYLQEITELVLLWYYLEESDNLSQNSEHTEDSNKKQNNIEFDGSDKMKQFIDNLCSPNELTTLKTKQTSNCPPLFVSFCKYFKQPTSVGFQAIAKTIQSIAKNEIEYSECCRKVLEIEFETISRIIQNAPVVTKPFYVYRGNKKNLLKSVKNNTFESKSFLSTSINPEIAIQFTESFGIQSKSKSSHRQCCLIKIHVLPGVKCLFIPPLAESKQEFEILFDKNQLIKIDKKNVPIQYQTSNYLSSFESVNKDSFHSFQSKVCSLKQHTVVVDFLTIDHQ